MDDSTDPEKTKERRSEGRGRLLRAAIIGGGKGCESVLRMVKTDSLGRFRMEIIGVADLDPDADGMRYAREVGVGLVTTDYKELYDLTDLDLLIELTGSEQMRDEIERTRPRNVRFIDHFGARLFWELHQAEELVLAQRSEMRTRVERERERISQIFDCIPDEILVVDTEMQIQDANHTFLQQNDLTIDEIRGKHCYEVDQDIRGGCRVAVGACPFFHVIREHQPVSLVRKHYSDDGTPRYAALVAAPLWDKEGALVGAVEMTRDITHRIRLEEELKVSEVRLQQFLENAPLATYVKNAQGVYIELNPATSAMLGKPKSDIVGKTDLEILPRAEAESMRDGDRDVLHDGATLKLEHELELPGKDLFLKTVKYPLHGPDGEVTAVCAVSEDVTAQTEALTALARTQEYLQNVLDNSPALIITTDLHSNIVSFNKGAEECLGYRAAEVIGMDVAELYPDPEERHVLLRVIQQQGSVRDHQTKLLHKDGTPVPVSITLSQLKNSAGETIGTVGISKDISHRKALLDQIVQSERMAAVGRLAAGVAHEINNPLAVINEIAGYLEDLATGGPGSEDADLMEELRDGLPRIQKQVRRGRDITFRLLGLARKTVARVTESDLNAALDEILPFLEKEARLKRITIHRKRDDDVPPVLIEEIQLQEIFINLIQNALQAMDDGKGANLWIECHEEKRKVIVTIKDDGPGISSEVRDRLFDPFVTTKPLGKGTGLGLSICYGIVKRYDGEIRVHSEPNEGATFQVILPVAGRSSLTSVVPEA